MPTALQKKMFREMEQKAIFRRAQNYAFAYADGVRDRNVFPVPEAIADLERFVEDLPASTGNAEEILAQLHEFGSPASVAQTGGRYFGFVNGGVIPHQCLFLGHHRGGYHPLGAGVCGRER